MEVTSSSLKCKRRTRRSSEKRKLKKQKKKDVKINSALLDSARDMVLLGNACIYEKTEADNSKEWVAQYPVITISGEFPPTNSSYMKVPRTTVIVVRPLVVLDLNGILCKRIRYAPVVKNNDSKNCPIYVAQNDRKYFREAVGNVAGTPVVPRMDLINFLQLLNSNFALAVWSSAKQRTVVKLISLLFPENISNNLLFSWGQEKCHTMRNGEDIVHTKPLQKIWEKYPLWDKSNTLLMDDTPAKSRNIKNTFNPPTLTGYKINTENGQDDEHNEREQRKFFANLAAKFKPVNVNQSRCSREDCEVLQDALKYETSHLFGSL